MFRFMHNVMYQLWPLKNSSLHCNFGLLLKVTVTVTYGA